MPTESTKQEALRRLAYIEGHLRGIRKMIEEDQYCVDVLKQSYAVRRAIEKVEMTILRGHLNSCVPEGIRDGREIQVIEEIAELFELGQK